jgi:hypothetical protein
VYDHAADPDETRDLVRHDPSAARPHVERLERYRAVRACQQRIEITTARAERR